MRPHKDPPPVDETLSAGPEPPSEDPRPALRHHFMVFHAETSTVVTIDPATLAEGEATIGRAPECHVLLPDPLASRRHATLLFQEDAVQLVDRSHNGTRVNGQRIAPARLLLSGDQITIGESSIIYHRDALSQRVRPLADIGQLRARIAEEISRLINHQRQIVTLLCLELPEREAGPRVVQALAPGLQPTDQLALSDDRHAVLILLTDLFEGEVGQRVRALTHTARGITTTVRAGYASCPLDCNDADTVLGSAREAARTAPPGDIAAASNLTVRLRIREFEAIYAEPLMHRLFEQMRCLARSDLSVLIRGETGTGKEIAATAIHEWSARKGHPFQALNCANFTNLDLLNSQLFGHVKGAFTGAVGAARGILLAAEGGTVFLDEIGELSLEAQAQLLRAIETRRVRPVGGENESPFNVRVIAATHRDLRQEIAAGRFRQDLFYRLREAEILLPPLRDRRRDLALLAHHFLQAACQKARRPPMDISLDAMQQLQEHTWPGNLRELRNLMTNIAATVPEEQLRAFQVIERLERGADPEARPATPSAVQFRPLDEEVEALERQRITQAMAMSRGNRTRAAALLSMSVRTLYNKLRRYGLVDPGGDPQDG